MSRVLFILVLLAVFWWSRPEVIKPKALVAKKPPARIILLPQKTIKSLPAVIQSKKKPEEKKVFFSSLKNKKPIKKNKVRLGKVVLKPQASKIIAPPQWDKGWDFQRYGLNPEKIKAFFSAGEPEKIHYWKKGELNILKNKERAIKNGRVLFISDASSREILKEEREYWQGRSLDSSEASEVNDESNSQDLLNKDAVPMPSEESEVTFENASAQEEVKDPALPQEQEYQKLAPQDYILESFTPGTLEGGKEEIALPQNIHFSIRGPDFSLEQKAKGDEKGVAQLREKVVSLGDKGEIIFALKHRGCLHDGPGADFTIFENVFRYNGDKVYQEIAKVGVAESNHPKKYRWFPCSPQKGEILGCAGLIPTAEGGDEFDLANLGVKKACYIKIKDIGINQGHGGQTQGFDFDALSLHYGYYLKEGA